MGSGHHEPGALYRHLFEAVYEAGETTAVPKAATVRSHQFIPAWLSAATAQDVAIAHGMTETEHWTQPHRCQAPPPTPESTCDLYVWPHGVAIFHVVDERSFSSLTTLALWRQAAYDQRLTWATTQLQPVAPGACAAYILSLYWLTASAWSGHDHETAMRILCMPPILLARGDDDDGHPNHDRHPDPFKHARARLVEDALLSARWDHPGIRSFGVAGTSCGYASWTGVLYHAQAPSRALGEDELIEYELALQSAWAYCAHLNDQVEQGRDPSVPPEWSWRYLRALRCRLANPRPQESAQHRSMREVILQTSDLIGHLDQAIEALREAAG
ncbi:MAG: hypothetical protein QOI48_2996 [Solirubrobacteraceae bacterium]|jgi:hypothetical protein|nr:hypothetical protein [Solirubrobacteraceae bacterium]